MEMSFVGLVSGYGTSLRPLTNYIKKEMYPILDKPYLAYMLENVRALTDHVILLVGPMMDQVKTYFGSYYKNLQISYAEQPDPQGTMDALMKVYKRYHIEKCIVWLGDTYTSKTDLEKLVYHSMPNIIAVQKVDFESKTPIVFNPETKEVTCCWKCKGPFANTGIYKLNKSFFNFYIENEREESTILETVQCSIEKGNKFWAIPIDVWLHLGDKEGTTFLSNLKKNQKCLKGIIDYFYKEM